MEVWVVKIKDERKNKNKKGNNVSGKNRETNNKLISNEIYIVNHQDINPEQNYKFIEKISLDEEYEIWTVRHKITGID